jgi:lipopolysaccharide transport system permease protein
MGVGSEFRPEAIVIQPSHGWMDLQLRSLWQYRELLYFMVWRDLKVRYKQTLLGVGWVVLQPLISVLVFTVLFGMLLNVPSGDVPYPVFSLCGLLPWQYFAGALNRSTTSIVDSTHLITKVYFPRLIVPMAATLSGLVDFGVGFCVLVILMIGYRIAPTARVLLLPALLFIAMATALGFGLWFAALNVRYRDVKQLIPFIIQTWMYLTPVVYSTQLIPEQYRWLLALNPMTGVVEGFRWALLGGNYYETPVQGVLLGISIVITSFTLVGGLIFFRRTEKSFADII